MNKKNSKYKNKTSHNGAMQYKQTILPNKLNIVSEQIPLANSFALGININFGSRDEPMNSAGIAHFIEHMNFRRTLKHNYRQIANHFENVGAYVNAFTNQESTLFYVRGLNSHFRKSLAMLMEIVFEPLYTHNDFIKEKDIIIEEIRSYNDDPEELIADIAESVAFPNHPLSNPIVGTEESLENIKHTLLSDYHQKFYIPQNTLISYVGSMEHQKLTENILGLCENKEFFKQNYNNPLRTLPPLTDGVRFIQHKKLQQSHIVLNKRIDSWKHDERYALLVLNTLFGEGMSSRLYQVLREKYGYVYSTYSSLNFYQDTGLFDIYAACSASNITNTETIIFDELNKLRTKPIKKIELNRAKEQLKSSVIMDMENLGARMLNLSKSINLTGIYEDANTLINNISDVSIDALEHISNKYLSEENWNAVIFQS